MTHDCRTRIPRVNHDLMKNSHPTMPDNSRWSHDCRTTDLRHSHDITTTYLFFLSRPHRQTIFNVSKPLIVTTRNRFRACCKIWPRQIFYGSTTTKFRTDPLCPGFTQHREVWRPHHDASSLIFIAILRLMYYITIFRKKWNLTPRATPIFDPEVTILSTLKNHCTSIITAKFCRNRSGGSWEGRFFKNLCYF